MNLSIRIQTVNNKSSKLSLQRESVFLQDKIKYTFKELKEAVQPDYLYEVVYSDKRGIVYRTRLVVEDEEEVMLYFRTLEALNNTWFHIRSIEKVGNYEQLR